MAWSFVAAGTVALGANPTPSLPSGLASGHLLVLVATSGTTFSTTPSGYTQVANHTASPFTTVWYKIAGASETAPTVTNANTTTAAVLVAYSGIATFDVVSTVSATTSTVVSTNSATTTRAGDLLLSIYGGAVATSGNRGWTANSSTVARVNQNRTTTNTGMLVADELQAAAGLTPSRLATTAQTAVIDAYMVAFKIPVQQAVTTTAATSTESLSRNTGKVITYNSNVVESETFNISTTKTISSTGTFTDNLSVLKPITASVANIARVTISRVYTWLLSTTSTVVSNIFSYRPFKFNAGINTYALNGKVVNSPPDRILNNYTQLLTAAVSSIESLVKGASKSIITTLISSTESLLKSVNKLLTTTLSNAVESLTKTVGKVITTTLATSTKSLIKAVNKLITTTAVTSTESLLKSISKTLITTVQSSIATILKTVNKLLTKVSTSTSSIVRQSSLFKTITTTSTTLLITAITFINSLIASVTVSSNLFKQTFVYRTITAVNTSIVTLSKFVNKYITRTVTVATTLTNKINIVKTIQAISNSLVTLSKLVNKLITSTVINFSTLKSNNGITQVLEAFSSTTVTVSRFINKYISVLQDSLVSIIKQVLTTKDATVTNLVTITNRVGKLLTALVSSDLTISKVVGAIRLALSSSVSTIVKFISSTVNAISTSTVVLSTADIFIHVLEVSVSSLVVLNNSINKLITTLVENLVTIVNSISKLITTVSESIILIIKYISFTILVINNTIATISRLVSRYFTITVLSTIAVLLYKQLSKILTTTSTIVSSIIRRTNKLVLITQNSIVTITKAVRKYIITNVDYVIVILTSIGKHLVGISYHAFVTATLRKGVFKQITKTVSSTALVLCKSLYVRLLDTLSSVFVDIDKFRGLILEVSVTTITSLTKLINKTLVAPVTIVISLIAQLILKYGAVLAYTLYAPVRKRVIALVKTNTLTINNIKDRLITLVKSRSIITRKDTDG